MERFWTNVDDETLLEVGRLTLAAVELEDTTYGVCRFVHPRHAPGKEPPVSNRIAQARKDCASRFEPGPAVDAMDAWLAETSEALRARNAILHSVPLVWVPLEDTTPVPESSTGPWLTYFPKDKTLSAVHTRLTADDIRPVRERLERVCGSWLPLLDALEEVRKPRV